MNNCFVSSSRCSDSSLLEGVIDEEPPCHILTRVERNIIKYLETTTEIL
jgi:hypothetical protein